MLLQPFYRNHITEAILPKLFYCRYFIRTILQKQFYWSYFTEAILLSHLSCKCKFLLEICYKTASDLLLSKVAFLKYDSEMNFMLKKEKYEFH